MKKILKILSVILLLTGCSLNNTQDWVGHYQGNQYQNEYFNFVVNFPDEAIFMDQKALESEDREEDARHRKIIHLNGFQQMDMMVYVLNDLEADHTVDREVENMTDFYRAQGFQVEPIELTREVAGKESRLLRLRLLNSTHDKDIYLRIHGDKLLMIQVSYPKGESKAAEELMNIYEAI